MKELTAQTWNEAENQKVTLVDFFSTTCPPCRLLKTILDPLSEEMEDQLSFYTLNVGLDENDELCESFNIEVVPTMIILKEGKEVARQEGAMPKPQLRQWIESLLDN